MFVQPHRPNPTGKVLGIDHLRKVIVVGASADLVVEASIRTSGDGDHRLLAIHSPSCAESELHRRLFLPATTTPIAELLAVPNIRA